VVFPTLLAGLPVVRLTHAQREQIMRAIHDRIGGDVEVWLYGSRTDDGERGGEVDLLIRTGQAVAVLDQAALQDRLERDLLLPVDVSFIDPAKGMTRFQRLVAASALSLEATR
jgi:predicted nucleotidyltransferase